MYIFLKFHLYFIKSILSPNLHIVTWNVNDLLSGLWMLFKKNNINSRHVKAVIPKSCNTALKLFFFLKNQYCESAYSPVVVSKDTVINTDWSL